MKSFISKIVLIFIGTFSLQSCEKNQDSFYSNLENLYSCKASYQEVHYLLHPLFGEGFITEYETEEKDTLIHFNHVLGNVFKLPEINANLYFEYQEDGSLVLVNDSYKPESDPQGYGITSGIVFGDSLRFTYQRFTRHTEVGGEITPSELYIAGEFYCVKQ